MELFDYWVCEKSVSIMRFLIYSTKYAVVMNCQMIILSRRLRKHPARLETQLLGN
jgi:hypothetical protein